MTSTGFARVAHEYSRLGWTPLPLPAGQKSSPPYGYTGTDGRTPTTDEMNAWVAAFEGGNVALRMPAGVIGIDVDHYGNKTGADTLIDLETLLGSLPVTWSSTSRGEDQPSRIYFYRVPTHLRFPGQLGKDIDVIQRHHRYAVVAPSTHDETGARYRWYDEHGQQATMPPDVNELPYLPPDWIEACLAPVEQQPQRQALPEPAPADGGDSIAARIEAEHDWHNVLIGDGWVQAGKQGRDTLWRRPGKEHGGASAKLYEPDGPLVCYSSSVGQLQRGWAEKDGHWSFSMFGYLAATRHDGDRSATARHYRQLVSAVDAQYSTIQTSVKARILLDGNLMEDAVEDDFSLAHLVNWQEFWEGDVADEDWLAYPLIPRGRAIALYAPAKAGKSTVVLALVAALVTGRPIFENRRAEPVHVLYLDYEMTNADLMERLTEMGYTEHDDLTRLHYALLPSMPTLDTAEGAAALLALAAHVGAELVVVDTFGRAVAGDENEADTVRAFYRHTGLALKSQGIAVLRTDHSGKDVEKGQRGSSAKADDVDVVFQLRRTETGAGIKATHSRLSWVPSEVLVDRVETGDGTTVWREQRTAPSFPPGTAGVIKHIEDAGIPVATSARQAIKLLRETGWKGDDKLVRAAQRSRQTYGETVYRTPLPHPSSEVRAVSAVGAVPRLPHPEKDQVTDLPHLLPHLPHLASGSAVGVGVSIDTPPSEPASFDSDELF